MRKVHRIHFVGIGGSGMSGIAEVLLNEGYAISGSDLHKNETANRLAGLGATIFEGHHEGNIHQADVVVVSSAVQADNVEVKAARARRIPIVRRAEMLAELMRFRKGIAVAGTHGKTTTTSLIASVLAEGGSDPTFIIGGKLNSAGSNAKLGLGEYLVAEADESDASFLHLQPLIAVVTNIDKDHMDTYGGDFNSLKKAFLEFIHRLPFHGLAIVCLDDPVVREVIPDISRPLLTFGFSHEADIQAINYRQVGTDTYFDVIYKPTGESFPVHLNLPGRHNVSNSLAAIGIGKELEIPNELIRAALSKFAGVGRRFQQLGQYHLSQGEALMVDDYGHHPREIAATIQSARESWPEKRLAMIFQPHRYTRTRDLFEDFVEALSSVDVLLLLDIYSAGEEPINGVDSRALCRSVRQRGKIDPIFVSHVDQLPRLLDQVLEDDDVLIAQGAGSVSSIVAQLLSSNRSTSRGESH